MIQNSVDGCREPIDDPLPSLRAGKTLQQFLKYQSRRRNLLTT